MPVILAMSARTPRSGFDVWCAIAGAAPALDPAGRVADLGKRLNGAFDAIQGEWFALARALGREPSAALAHAPACAANASDLGLMLAWTRVVESLAAESRTTLVLCDDPWLFRHLADRPGVRAGRPPKLASVEFRLRLRGLAARARVAARMALAAIRFSAQRKSVARQSGPWILAYAHPASAAGETDAYFGGLMTKVHGLARVLHVDGPSGRARRICGTSKQTLSLHAFGSPLFALTLVAARWRPRAEGAKTLSGVEGANAWLIRRAAAREGGTGQPAMLAWQIHCQNRWLAAAHPTVVAWPWENHSWERALVCACRSLDVKTVGYQHATVGRREWNYAPDSNPDEASLPDQILCAGSAWAARLRAFGHRAESLAVGGAWRMPSIARLAREPSGPVFVALPSDAAVAAEMIAAIQPLARRGSRFIVRDHPMTPFPFAAEPGIGRADGPLAAQKKIAAVLYAGTTVGLEAVLGGLPTVCFLPETTIANDILPDGLSVPTASAAELGDVLRQATAAPAPDARNVFAPVEIDIWRAALRA